jgi:hypothetical protein
VHYLLPIKAGANDDLQELAQYVAGLSSRLPVIVIDGSDPDTFRRNQALFASVRHVPPRPELRCANGKVAGVLTGFALAASDKVVIADDDVRYEPAGLARLERLLDEADIVIPQNYYGPLPWPARWDTARMLVNRALPSGDYPGTLGVRLSPRMRRLGYDGDVLFENLELIRSVIADGGQPLVARDLYVRRLPPTAKHFAGQRVRQAYDSLAQPGRLAGELAMLPLAVAGARHPRVLGCMAATSIVAAEFGRRRAGGAPYFPASASWLAPAWLGERAICSWIALGRRVVLGGTPYAGRRLSRAATSVRELRRERARSCGSRRRTA